MDEKINVITKGVVQASIISSILSDIYYNFILHKATNLAIGTVIKYVNDILYITVSETYKMVKYTIAYCILLIILFYRIDFYN